MLPIQMGAGVCQLLASLACRCPETAEGAWPGKLRLINAMLIRSIYMSNVAFWHLSCT